MKKHTLLFFICFLSLYVQAQSTRDVATGYLSQAARDYGLSDTDIADWVITDEHVSSISGVNHIYLRQQYRGVEIKDANLSLHVSKENELLKINCQFVADLTNRINTTIPRIREEEAIEMVARELGYSFSQSIHSVNGKDSKVKYYRNEEISREDIPVRLVYLPNGEDDLLLAWDMVIYETKGPHIWTIQADASTGEIVEKMDRVIVCDHSGGLSDGGNPPELERTNADQSEIPHREVAENSDRSMVGGYRVFPFPLTDPDEGNRALVNDPDDPIASPFGWHDTNGATGSEFTVTRGNNIHAYVAGNDDSSPDGGSSLLFDFPLDLTGDADDFEDASVTNTFYWSNLAHDIFYQYGFDEVSGNCQENNYNNGGIGNDYMEVEVQTTLLIPPHQATYTTCNGHYFPTIDGEKPTIKLTLCGGRDGAYDSHLILHEYAHGLTTRLIGGAATFDCVYNKESPVEGWSDWYAIMLTIEADDVGSDPVNYGSWFSGTPDGDRSYPYSTDMDINPLTYDDIKDANGSYPNYIVETHDVGEIWASMLWEMTWLLIDAYGFDADIYTGNGGNNIALRLATEALKIVPCNGGFIDARDAIFAADVALYGGANECLIWEAFAKRGLGAGADQGSADDVTDGAEAFDAPCVGCQDNHHLLAPILPSTYRAKNNISASGVIASPDTTTFLAGGFMYLHTSFLVEKGATFCARITPCVGGNLQAPDDPQYRYSPFANTPGTSDKPNRFFAQITNVPNPFSQSTTFTFELHKTTEVELSIYDISGRKITTLIDREQMEEGLHTYDFNAQNVPAGIYLYRLSTTQGSITKKMIIK